jgi:hypothetical protein
MTVGREARRMKSAIAVFLPLSERAPSFGLKSPSSHDQFSQGDSE